MAALTGALIAAGATLGGAALASSASKKASSAAQQTAANANATDLAIFNQQRADLAPWRAAGGEALAEIRKRLGLTPTSPTGGPAIQSASSLESSSGVPGHIANKYLSDYGDYALNEQLMSHDGGNALASTMQYGAPVPVGSNALATTAAPAAAAPPGDGRYSGFYASPGYDFRMREGIRGITGSKAVNGLLQSGSALKDTLRYSQDYASNEFNNQLNQLFSVAGIGQSAVSQGNALAGNYGNNVNANNAAASQALQSSYATQGNAWQNALGTLGGLAYSRWG